MAVCLEWSRAAQLGRQGTLTEGQARKVVSEIVERAGGQPLDFHSIADWLRTWVEGKEQTKSKDTARRYRQVTRDFITHLGDRAKLNIGQVTVGDLQSYRRAELESGKSPRTCNLLMTILGAALNAARRQGLIVSNPAEALESLFEEKVERDVFTPPQLAAILAAAEGEWKGMLILGFFTGARLLDVALMRWNCVDLVDRMISYIPRKTAKTGKLVTIPLHPDLENYLVGLASRDKKAVYVFPELAAIGLKVGSAGEDGLSATFKRIMITAGVTGTVLRERKGKGRSVNSLSFHSLRHSFNSAMANAGVSQEVRQKLTGHASAEVNKIYTHHEMAPLRAAVALIPRIERKIQK